MPNRVRLYVLVVSVVAVAATYVVYAAAPAYTPAYLRAAVYLCVLGVVADLLMYHLPRGATGSIAFIPFLATALISPNWEAIAAVGAANIASEAIRQRARLKAMFNIAQTSLAMSMAIIVYTSLGGESLLQFRSSPLRDITGTTLVPAIALIVVFFAINSVLVSMVIAINEGRGILRVWQQNTLGTIVYDVMASPVVFLLAWIFIKSGPLGAVFLAVPLLGVRQLYRTNLELEQVNQELLELMVKAIEARDPYTSGHSRRVAHYAKLIARAIGLSSKQVERVGTCALLHDVGKIHEIYAPILRKPDKLTADEWAIMQTHPIKSAELVATVSHLRDLVPPVRHHHENWDGSGYPDGLVGQEIPLESRVIIFADTIDAMTTDRPYRKALGETEVRAELIKFRGKQFDPSICDRLLASPVFGLLFAPMVKELTPKFNAAIPARSKPRIVVGA